MGNLLSKGRQSERDNSGNNQRGRQGSIFRSLRHRMSKHSMESKEFQKEKCKNTVTSGGTVRTDEGVPETTEPKKVISLDKDLKSMDSTAEHGDESTVKTDTTEEKVVYKADIVSQERDDKRNDGKDESSECPEVIRGLDVTQPKTTCSGQHSDQESTCINQSQKGPEHSARIGPVSVHPPVDPTTSGSEDRGLKSAVKGDNPEEYSPVAPGIQIQTTVTGDHNTCVTAGDNAVINIYQEPNSYTQESIKPVGPFPLTECQEALKNHYRRRRSKVHLLPWNQDFTDDLDNIFTSVDLMAYTKCCRDFQGQPLESIVDIFNDNEEFSNPQQIMLWGSAGIGKTTILAKLVMSWTNRSSEALTKYDLVFEIALRQVKKSQSLVDCIFDQLLPYDAPFTVDELSEFIKDNNKVLIILDGYDEFEGKKTHDIYRLLSRKILPNSTVVVTTTPTRVSDLVHLMDPDTRAEILGFNPENITVFIQKWFKTTPEQGQALVQRISPTLLYTGILSVPFLLVLTCLLWEEDSHIPLSDQVCPLYDRLVSYLVKRHQSKGTSPQTPAETEQTLSSLGALAYDSLQKNYLIFSEADVQKYCRSGHEAPVHLGFLQMQKNTSRLNPAYQFSFSHKTMQEYFAGRHLASKLQSEDDSVRKDTLHSCFPNLKSVLQFDNLIMFTCGRLGHDASFVLSHLDEIYCKSNVKDLEDEFYTFFKTAVPKRKWKTDVTLEGLSNSQGEEVELRYSGQWNDYPRDLLIYQNSMEVFLLSCYESEATESFAEVLFKRNTIQFSGANPRLYSVLSQVIADGKKKTEQLRLVNTQDYVLGSVLEQLHKLSHLTELNLRQSRLGQHKVECTTPDRLKRRFLTRQTLKLVNEIAKAPGLLAKQLPSLTLLKKLVISWNDLGPEDMKQLLPAIEQLKDLEELFLSGNDLSGLGMEISALVASLPKLKVFKVYFCQLCLEEILDIASSLQQHCPDLTLFDFQLNPVQMGGSSWIGKEEKQLVCEELREGVTVCWETVPDNRKPSGSFSQ